METKKKMRMTEKEAAPNSGHQPKGHFYRFVDIILHFHFVHHSHSQILYELADFWARMYPAESRGGSSSTRSSGTPQQNKKANGAGGAERPSTRRGRQTGSGESAGGDGMENGLGAGERRRQSVEHNGQAQRNGVVVDVWARPQPQSAGNGSRNSRRGEYPELSEPEERYSTDQFESEDEEGGNDGKEGESEFEKKLREMAAKRTRSLHALPEAAKHGATTDEKSESRKSSTSTQRSSSTDAQGAKNGEAEGHRKSSRSESSTSVGSSSSSSNTKNGAADQSRNGGTMVEEVPVAAQRTTAAPFVSRLAAMMGGGGSKAERDNTERRAERGTEVKIDRGTSSVRSSGGGSEDGGNLGGKVTRHGRMPPYQQTPLGFGSSSSRNFILSASGRGQIQQPREARARNANVGGIRGGAGDSAEYRAWLNQKLAVERERRRKEAERKAEEEAKREEKKKLAERNFERWKQELDKRMAAKAAEEKRKAGAREERKKRAEQEKRTNAEKTFMHWKETEEQRRRSEMERAKNAKEQRKAEEERKAEQKRTQGEAAYREWMREQNERKREEQQKEQERARRVEEERREQAEERKKIAAEAYELWMRMKDEERRYTQSLAYRILDFESRAAQRWASNPWLPTSPSTPTKMHRPPPELANGRRRTLERRVVLPHSQPTSSSGRRSTPQNKDGKGAATGGRNMIMVRARSAAVAGRPWR